MPTLIIVLQRAMKFMRGLENPKFLQVKVTQNLPQRFYSILQYLIYLQWFDPGHTGFHEIKLTMFKNLNSKQKYAKSFLDIDKHWEECTPAYSKTGA